MKNIFYYQSQIGEIVIAEQDNHITNLFFGGIPSFNNEYKVKETFILVEANKQLEEYFIGKRKTFSLPLAPAGTDFMRSVWNSLGVIPYGETRSYKDIAQSIGKPNAFRAVGQANNKNPIPIFIPCHRVIGADGTLVGYAGGIEIKKHFLNLEKKYGNL